jgi:hypothetical protein
VARGIPAILVDKKGDLANYVDAAAWERPLLAAGLDERRRRLRAAIDVALFTPGRAEGRPLSLGLVPDGLDQLGEADRQETVERAASALAGMLGYGVKSNRDQAARALLARALVLLARPSAPPVTLGRLIEFIAEPDPSLVAAAGRLDTKNFNRLVQDLEALRLGNGRLLEAAGERLDIDLLLGRGAHAVPGKTRLSIISTQFLGDLGTSLFWVAHLLLQLTGWAARNPAPDRLQGVILLDEADLYLPAGAAQPATKQPIDNLLRRARSTGIGLLLSSQNPGDFEYKARDTIRSWFVGRIQQTTSIAKMKPMLSEVRTNVASRLPALKQGRFYLIREGAAIELDATPSCVAPEQRSLDQILKMSKR